MSGKTIIHRSGMREHVPDERGFRLKEGEDLGPALLELAREVRGLDRRISNLEPATLISAPRAAGITLPDVFIIERKMQKVNRRALQAITRLARVRGGAR
ncbi:MAG: hypothetical protein WCP22_03335 [Chlamydiota bacterium]